MFSLRFLAHTNLQQLAREEHKEFGIGDSMQFTEQGHFIGNVFLESIKGNCKNVIKSDIIFGLKA